MADPQIVDAEVVDGGAPQPLTARGPKVRPITDDDLYPEFGDSSPMTATQARRVTEQIKLDIIGLWELVKMAYIGRA
jgi:hypothetical protein